MNAQPPTTKAETVLRITAQLNQQAVASLVDTLAEMSVENERLKGRLAALEKLIPPEGAASNPPGLD